jgi:ferric-chelate reductase
MTFLSPRRQMRSRSLGLLSIVVLLVTCAAFTLGLTFAPCHSSICVEHWFPSRTRIHLATFYGGVGIVAAYLTAWFKLEAVRSFSDYYVLDTPIPVIGARLSVGGTLLAVWILALTLATTGYWLHVEHAFWLAKGTQAGWTPYMFRVTWAGVTGHWCDILIGLVFLPASRNNVISTAFGVQASTLLLAHKVLAYTLCAFELIHGLLYYVGKISLHLHVLVPY